MKSRDLGLAICAAVATVVVVGYQLYSSSKKKKTVQGTAWKSAEMDETQKSGRNTTKSNSNRQKPKSDLESFSLAPKAEEKKQLASVQMAPASPGQVSINLAPVLPPREQAEPPKRKRGRPRKEKNHMDEEETGVRTAQLISGADIMSDGETKDVNTAIEIGR